MRHHLAIGLGLLTACGNKDAPPPAPQVAAPVAMPEAPPPVVPAAPPDLARLPADSEAIVHVDLTRLTNSSLWPVIRPALTSGWFGAELERVRTACGLDPFVTVRSVTVGYRHLDTASPETVAVVHGVGRAQALACAGKLGAQITGDQALAATAGLQVLEDDTVVVVRGPEVTAAQLDAIRTTPSALPTSAVVLEMLGKVHTGDAVWALINGASITRTLAPFGISPKAVLGSLELTSGLHLDLRLRATTAEDAAPAAQRLRTLLGSIAGNVGALAITTEAADVHLVMDVSGAQLAKLAGLAELP